MHTSPTPVPARVLRAAAVCLALTLLVLAAACGSDGADSATTTTAAADRQLSPEVQSELRDALDEVMTTFDVPGAVMAVSVPGEETFVATTGTADVATDAPVTGDMVWPLRSITKSFAVTLMLQLVDEGVMTLDDTIDQYVPGVPNGSEITLRQLANMTSGVPEYTTEAFVEAFSADPTRIFTLEELNAFALADPPQFPPGTQHVYTNTSTNLLGAAIEQATGQPFVEVVNEKILEPVGLTSTAYLGEGEPWAEPHATGYTPADGEMEEQPANFSVFGPAGALVSTLEDQLVWGKVLASGELLEPETQVERLLGTPLEEGPEYDRYALGIGEVSGWWGHTGEGFGFTALTMHDNESGATVVIFMNIAQPEPEGHVPTVLFRQVAAIVEGAI